MNATERIVFETLVGLDGLKIIPCNQDGDCSFLGTERGKLSGRFFKKAIRPVLVEACLGHLQGYAGIYVEYKKG